MNKFSYLEKAKKFIEENEPLFKEREAISEQKWQEIQKIYTVDNGSTQENTEESKTCRACGGKKFWRSKSGGHLVCPKCHPPASEEQISEWVEIGKEVIV